MSVEAWLEGELRFSRSGFVSWGRRVIRAIDLDDALALCDVFLSPKTDYTKGVDVNHQVGSISGYGGHLWSAWMHTFHGDTALHIALKQQKMLCVYALLLLGASTTITNKNGETPESLAMSILGIPIEKLQKDAMRELFKAGPNRIPAKYFDRLPVKLPFKTSIVGRENANEKVALKLKIVHDKKIKDSYKCVGGDITHEATRLLEEGRCLYCKPPPSFRAAPPSYTRDNSNRPRDTVPMWERKVRESEKQFQLVIY